MYVTVCVYLYVCNCCEMYMSIGFSSMSLCEHLGTSPLRIADDRTKGAMDLPSVCVKVEAHRW